MSLKKCDQCQEMVDEAKAFCPDCGHPFVVEEVRSELTEHDSSEGTMMLGKTAYGIMLAEMELDITEQPEAKKTPDVPKETEAAQTQKPSKPPKPPAQSATAEAGVKAESNSRRPFPVILGAIFLLVLLAVVLTLFIAQPFSK